MYACKDLYCTYMVLDVKIYIQTAPIKFVLIKENSFIFDM